MYKRQEESDEELLGRARATEKSFAPEAKASRPRIETPEMRFSELQRQTSAYMNEPDEEMLEKAFLFARDAHAGQCRKSGEPFIAHPVEVAIILADLRMDVESICAALLHDTVEAVSYTHLGGEIEPVGHTKMVHDARISRADAPFLLVDCNGKSCLLYTSRCV